MSFVFHCPKCQQKFCYDDSFNGQEMTCISCGERFVIEGTEDAEETSAVPASGSEEVEKYIAKFRKEHHFSVPHSGEKAFDKNTNEVKDELLPPVREYKTLRSGHPAPAAGKSQAPSLSRELKDMSIFCLIMGVIGIFEGDD